MFPTLTTLSTRQKKIAAPSLTTRAPVRSEALDAIEMAFFASLPA
jgi:hypothetical protein